MTHSTFHFPEAVRQSAITGGEGVGGIVVEVETVDSTNRLLADLGREGAAHGTVLIARDQNAGRGKGERAWFSTVEGSLCLSVLIRTRRSISQAAQLTLLAAVALRETIALTTGVEAGIKWPNDLLVDGRKICGILAEAVCDEDGELACVVVGMGINLAIADDEFPEDLRGPATSLATLAGRAVDREAFVETLGRVFDRWTRLWERRGLAAFAATWTAHAVDLGRVVHLTDGDEDLCAMLVGLAADGALRIRGADGAVRDVHSGEISTEAPVGRIPSHNPKTHMGAFS
ncbi:MAG: biotin--[acetyl-CoA-carboxylase] ligase [Phyllobacteriaceae bacterium]|nr:biotin--[acetyl-CoA-carboxylase] ligase [Phyllobacteriaceae bacterium]